LNNRCLLHQLFQLLEIAVRFVTFPDFLNQNGCQIMPTWSLKHELRVIHDLFNLLFVTHALQHIVIGVFLQLHFCIFQKFLRTYICKSNIILTNPSLNAVEQLTDRSPFSDILPFELRKLF
jgi:hypothetical protein